MEIPRPRVVNVGSTSPPEYFESSDDDEPLVFEAVSDPRHRRQGAVTLAQIADASISREISSSGSSSLQRSDTDSPRSPFHDSVSTAPAIAREQRQLAEEELSELLEWFSEALAAISRHGRVSLKDFKTAAREREVSQGNIVSMGE